MTFKRTSAYRRILKVHVSMGDLQKVSFSFCGKHRFKFSQSSSPFISCNKNTLKLLKKTKQKTLGIKDTIAVATKQKSWQNDAKFCHRYAFRAHQRKKKTKSTRELSHHKVIVTSITAIARPLASHSWLLQLPSRLTIVASPFRIIPCLRIWKYLFICFVFVVFFCCTTALTMCGWSAIFFRTHSDVYCN